MKYVLVTGYPENDENAQMETISEDGTTFICQNSKNSYPDNVSGVSAAVTDENIITSCGGWNGKFF